MLRLFTQALYLYSSLSYASSSNLSSSPCSFSYHPDPLYFHQQAKALLPQDLCICSSLHCVSLFYLLNLDDSDSSFTSLLSRSPTPNTVLHTWGTALQPPHPAVICSLSTISFTICNYFTQLSITFSLPLQAPRARVVCSCANLSQDPAVSGMFISYLVKELKIEGRKKAIPVLLGCGASELLAFPSR